MLARDANSVTVRRRFALFRQIIVKFSTELPNEKGNRQHPRGLSHSREFSGFDGSNPGVLPAPTPVLSDWYPKLRLQTVQKYLGIMQ